MVGALGVLLPIAFIAGIAARQPAPVAATVASELSGIAHDYGAVFLTDTDLWPDHRIITSLRRNASGSVAAEFILQDLVKPDVLVYWVAGPETAGERLPDNARLIGPLANGAPLSIPAAVLGESGRFILYSLADHEIVAVSRSFVPAKE